jgi:hypothetical protein
MSCHPASVAPSDRRSSPHADFFLGTFLPFARAFESPIAMARFLLFTVLPLRPLLSVPVLRRFMGPCQTKSGPMHHGMRLARQEFQVRIRP